MSNKPLNPEAKEELDKLKMETAEELKLDDDVQNRGWENMTTREVGKIGGNMVKKMIGMAEDQMVEKQGDIQ